VEWKEEGPLQLKQWAKWTELCLLLGAVFKFLEPWFSVAFFTGVTTDCTAGTAARTLATNVESSSPATAVVASAADSLVVLTRSKVTCTPPKKRKTRQGAFR
jgi:hypothetical protein